MLWTHPEPTLKFSTRIRCSAIQLPSSSRSRDNAEGQINRIRDAIKKLNKFPKKNPLVPYEPWSSLGMRRMNVDNYAVLYLVDEDRERVEIVRIPFGAMDLEKFFEENLT